MAVEGEPGVRAALRRAGERPKAVLEGWTLATTPQQKKAPKVPFEDGGGGGIRTLDTG